MSGRSRAWAAVLAGVVVGVSVVTVPTATQAAPPSAGSVKVDPSLGLGLGRLLADQSGSSQRRSGGGGVRVDPEALTVRDDRGRVLVALTPQAGVDRSAFRRSAEAAGLVVPSKGPAPGPHERGVVLDDVEALNGLAGRGTLSQAVRPRTSVGAATSQGVALQRVDRVQKRGLDGAGVTIGALSDSYDQATTTVPGDPLRVHAAQDVASGDLPGAANPRYRTPVAVLDDSQAGEDEGRAMLQIAHDVAPAAKLCFATAFSGSIGFADNIRRLADPAQGCGADVIVDDVTYFDEPMFSDGPIADAVDDVAARGVHYFSSAGNDGVRQAWSSGVSLVPAASALKGTNLDLTGVDPSLYDGGFQDLRNGAGVDVAQNLTIGPDGGLVNVQWDDPTDLDGATFGAPYFSAQGVVSDAEPAPTFTFTPTADQVGHRVQFRTDAIPTGTTDLVLTVRGPDGRTLGSVDSGSSPEVLSATLAQAGPYTITVSGFKDAAGDFTVDVVPVLSASKVTTDFNVLLFTTSGNYLGAIADANTLTGRPQELASLGGPGQVQMVITRSGRGKPGATRLRNVLSGDIAFAELVDPLAPATFGHHTALGGTGVAAYDPFRPFLPEGFTSPGGRLGVFFDSAGRRLPRSRQTRQTPQIASTDGGNTTFFAADSSLDTDTRPNFFGTSAAAPHAAGIAALAVQRARQQHRALSPTALRTTLERSTFAHDLDPGTATGKVDGLTLTARGDQSGETELLPGSMTDRRFFTLQNVSGKTVRSVTLDGSTASPTALGSARSKGIVFDPRRYDATRPRRQVGFPFTVGATSGGLRSSSVAASYAQPNGKGQFRKLKITFRKGLKKGQTLQFGVDRDLAVSFSGANAKAGPAAVALSNEGNGADELGGAVVLPSGAKNRSGLTFTVVRTNGRSKHGQLRNKLGSGFTPVDGFGLVDAEKAVVGR